MQLVNVLGKSGRLGRKCDALVITGETGQLTYYKEVASRLVRDGFKISICCDRDDPGVATAVRAAATEAGADFFQHLGDRGPPSGRKAKRASTSKIFSWLKRLTKNSAQTGYFDPKTGAPRAQLQALREYHQFRMEDAFRILRQARPTVLVLGEDGIGADYWAIAAAKRMKIPVVVLPYGMADSTSLIWKGLEQKAHENSIFTIASPGAGYIKEHYPYWFKDTRFGETLYFTPSFILALEEQGVHIPRPWCFQGGVSDIILIEGPEMRARYRAEGVEADKIVQVGAIYSDVIHDVLMSDRRYLDAYQHNQAIGMDETKLLVCVPSSEAESWRVKREFTSIQQYLLALRAVCEEIPGLKISYSFHPRMSSDDREHLARLGFHPSSEFVVSLITKHDIVLTCHSSTTRWALAARKPVIDFDLQQFHSNFFPGCAGFVFCEAFTDVASALRRLVSDRNHYRDLSQASAEFGTRFGPVDGRAAERIGVALKGVAAMKAPAEIAHMVANDATA